MLYSSSVGAKKSHKNLRLENLKSNAIVYHYKYIILKYKYICTRI